MGRNDHVLHVPKWTVLREGFVPENVEACPGNRAAAQGFQQRGLVHAGAPGHVYQIGRPFHLRECGTIDEAPCLVVQSAGENDVVGLLQHLVGLVRCEDLVGRALGRSRVSLGRQHLHVEGLGYLRHPGPYAPHTEDPQGLACQLVLPFRRIGDHAPPDVLALVVSTRMKVSGKGQDQGKYVLANRIPVHPACVGKPNAPGLQLLNRELVISRADGLDIS